MNRGYKTSENVPTFEERPWQPAWYHLSRYLNTAYEPDAEYVDGVIEERPAGEWGHAAWQMAIGAFFFYHSDEWSIRVRPAQRTKTTDRRFRIPMLPSLTRTLSRIL